MKKILVEIVIVAMLILGILVLGYNHMSHVFSGHSQINIEDTILVVTQKDKKLYLEGYDRGHNGTLNLKIKSVITKIDRSDVNIPTSISKVNDKKLLISVGHYDDNPIKIFEYDFDEEKIHNIGTVEASNPNVVVGSEKLYTFRLDETISNGYWVDEYSLDNLNSKLRSIKLPEAPKKMIYSSDNNSIYFIFIGGTPASLVGKYSLTDQSLVIKEIEQKSFAGDMTECEGKIYISMSGYSTDEKNSIEDDRIIVLGKDLEKQRTIKTSKNPRLISINKDYIYTTFGNRTIAFDKILLSDGEVKETQNLKIPGFATAIKATDQFLLMADSRTLYCINENGQISKQASDGMVLCIW